MEMQLKQRSSTLATAKRLFHQGGVLTFWKGNGMNLLRVTPHKVHACSTVESQQSFMLRSHFRAQLRPVLSHLILAGCQLLQLLPVSDGLPESVG